MSEWVSECRESMTRRRESTTTDRGNQSNRWHGAFFTAACAPAGRTGPWGSAAARCTPKLCWRTRSSCCPTAVLVPVGGKGGNRQAVKKKASDACSLSCCSRCLVDPRIRQRTHQDNSPGPMHMDVAGDGLVLGFDPLRRQHRLHLYILVHNKVGRVSGQVRSVAWTLSLW